MWKDYWKQRRWKMKGSYWFKAKSKKVLFEFSIRRNITIIKGDSATGKTTLLRILYEYLRIGRQSGYAVSTNASYYVYIRDEVGRDWKDALYPLKNTVIFIEENNEFVFTKEFASYVKESGNYFVFVTRAPLKMLPYSIHEIYEIITDGKRTDIKESYHEFKEIYSNYPIIENNKIQNVVTEDSNSGYQFWMQAFKNSNVTSSNGNGNLIKCVKELGLDNIPEYVECEKYESWEKFFTEILITLTADGVEKYSKNILNSYYLQDWVVDKIKEQLPIEVIN